MGTCERMLTVWMVAPDTDREASITTLVGEEREGRSEGRTWGWTPVWIKRRRIATSLRYHEGRENEPTHLHCIDLHV
jgi:hypothetical protein